MCLLNRTTRVTGPRRSARCAAVILAVAAVVWGDAHITRAGDAPGHVGRRLADVLREFEKRGLKVIFSSAVVRREQRVTVEPVSAEPRVALDEILEPLGLKAQDGPGGTVVILRSGPEVSDLRGRVVSLAGGRPIVGASVRLPATGASATTGAGGTFEIAGVPAGTYDVVVAAPGFSTATFDRVRVTLGGGTPLTVELKARPAFVTDVVVTPSRHSVVREDQASRHSVTHAEALLLPTIGGDVSRMVEQLPGVAAPDSSAAFNVRGSLARDVGLVLDGLELYDPFHFQDFHSPFSLIDSSVVDRVDVLGGGFTADLGDRHGGFVEVATLVPGLPGRGEVELGTLNSRVSYQTPIPGASGSLLLSARSWYPEAVVSGTQLVGGESLDPRFSDLYLKTAFILGQRHSLSAHGLLSYDRIEFRESGETINESVNAVTGNNYAWLRLLSVWSPRLSSSTLVSGGRLRRTRGGLSSAGGDGPLAVDDRRTVDFFGLKHDASWQVTDGQLLKGGAEVRWLDAEYRYRSGPAGEPEPDTAPDLDPRGTSLGVYGAYRARLGPELTAEVGARWDRQDYTNDNQLSPRFNAVWQPSERSELRLALGRFSQSQRINELHVEDGESEFSPAEASEQAELSFQRWLGASVQLRLDAYYRRLSRLRPRYENLWEPVELFPETSADRVRVDPERARLRGLELMLRGDANRPLFWWASYARSSAEDSIDGVGVPRSWDQPHAGKFLVGYRRDERWSISLSGTAHSGWPTTPGEVVTQADGSSEIGPGARNSDRFDPYYRLDLKARRSFALPHGRLWLTVELINLTDRRNACCVNDFMTETRPDGGIDVREAYDFWLGLTPSYSVLWRF